ncbi:MAG: hypothetical protein AABY13_03340, partial [Nanoarchaeota archaeon]
MTVLVVVVLCASVAYAQFNIPEVEGECVPVDPNTGAPCPECCDGGTSSGGPVTRTEEPEPAEPEAEPESCTTPTLTACPQECTVLRQRQCVFPQWRECRQECAGLPSYPTYEFEDCLTECDNRNVQDRQDYDDCVAQGPSS